MKPHSLNAWVYIVLTLGGSIIYERLPHFSKASSPIYVSPVKYFNSGNISMLDLRNTLPISVTAAASALLNSPSLFVSQLAIHISFTLVSEKEIIFEFSFSSNEISSYLISNLFSFILQNFFK